MSKRALSVSMLPLLSVVLAGALLLSAPAFAEPSILVKTEVVKVRQLDDVAQVVGKVVPRPQKLQWLTAGKAGIVGAVFVSPGERVKKGQTLVAILNSPSSQAAWQQAQATLNTTRESLSRVRRLHEERLADDGALARAKAAFRKAQLELASLQAGGVGSQAHLIEAASDGVVVQWRVSGGQWVTAGQPIGEVAPAGGLWIRFGLTPGQLERARVHDDVLMKNAFRQGSAFIESHIVSIARQVDPQTGLIDVSVPVPGDSEGLLPGSWVVGRISLARMKVPTVSRSAVLKDKQGDYVFVVRDGKANKAAVQLLIRSGDRVGVSGLRPGDVVVTQGNFGLEDGTAVREKP